MKIEVEKIQRLQVEPGETLVFTLPAHTEARQVQDFADAVKERVPDGIKVLVVTSGVELSVIAEPKESVA